MEASAEFIGSEGVLSAARADKLGVDGCGGPTLVVVHGVGVGSVVRQSEAARGEVWAEVKGGQAAEKAQMWLSPLNETDTYLAQIRSILLSVRR